MSLCEAVPDRMPAVASGRSEWTAKERSHLASCSECAAEWKLVGAAATLGREVTQDTEALAPVVLARVRAAKVEEGRRRWVRQATAVGTLAVAAVLLIVLLLPEQGVVGPDPMADVLVEEPAGLRLAELDDAAPEELMVVLAEFEEPASPASSLDEADLGGVDQLQVEQALRSWEES